MCGIPLLLFITVLHWVAALSKLSSQGYDTLVQNLLNRKYLPIIPTFGASITYVSTMAIENSTIDIPLHGVYKKIRHNKREEQLQIMNQPVSAQTRPVITLMTDFGLGDGDVGIMKGVIAGITPLAHIIDITHDIAPQNVPSAAWILATAYHYFPAGTVFVCVIDPGVGSSRGAIVVHAGDWFFVGPDNGLFSYILQEQPIHAVHLLSNPAYHLTYVSSTFHARDI